MKCFLCWWVLSLKRNWKSLLIHVQSDFGITSSLGKKIQISEDPWYGVFIHWIHKVVVTYKPFYLSFLCSRYQSTCTSVYCIWIFQISKRGGKPHDRMFFLFSDILLYGKPRLLDSTNNSYTCCCVLPLKHCQLETVFGGSKRGAQENTEAGGMFKVCVDHSVRKLILEISALRGITLKGAQKNTKAFCL